jgi:hypothetical protein
MMNTRSLGVGRAVIAISILSAIIGFTSSAQAQNVGIRIVEFGQYVVGGETRIDAPGQEKYGNVATRHLLQQTDCIAIQPKIRFGVVVRHTSDASLKVPVRIVVKHPPMTKPDGKVETSDSWDKVLISEGLYAGWRVDAPHEMVPGAWTFQVEHEGKVAAQKKFTVVTGTTRCR